MIRREWRTRLLGAACLGGSWGCALWLRTLMEGPAGDASLGEIGLLLASFGLTFIGLPLLNGRHRSGSAGDRAASNRPLDRS